MDVHHGNYIGFWYTTLTDNFKVFHTVCLQYIWNYRVMCPFCSNAECYFACARAKLQIKLWYLSTLGRKIKIFYIQALFSLMNHVPSAWFLRGRLFISFLIAALTSSEKVNPLVYLFEFNLTEAIFFLDYGIYLVNSSALVYTSNTRKYDVTIHCTDGYTVIESMFTLYIRRNNPPNFTNLPSKPKTWINNMEIFLFFLKIWKHVDTAFAFFAGNISLDVTAHVSGSHIFTASAVDTDTSSLTYSISCDGSCPFRINGNSKLKFNTWRIRISVFESHFQQ